jgi:hypothetical protein
VRLVELGVGFVVALELLGVGAPLQRPAEIQADAAEQADAGRAVGDVDRRDRLGRSFADAVGEVLLVLLRRVQRRRSGSSTTGRSRRGRWAPAWASFFLFLGLAASRDGDRVTATHVPSSLPRLFPIRSTLPIEV